MDTQTKRNFGQNLTEEKFTGFPPLLAANPAAKITEEYLKGITSLENKHDHAKVLLVTKFDLPDAPDYAGCLAFLQGSIEDVASALTAVGEDDERVFFAMALAVDMIKRRSPEKAPAFALATGSESAMLEAIFSAKQERAPKEVMQIKKAIESYKGLEPQKTFKQHFEECVSDDMRWQAGHYQEYMLHMNDDGSFRDFETMSEPARKLAQITVL